MHPSRLPRPVRLALYALAVVILLYLCLAPSQDLPNVQASDRFEHSAAWFVLTATGLILAPRRPRAIAAFAAVLGLVVEILQGVMPLGRHADVLDYGADLVGLAIAMAGYPLLRRLAR